MIAGIYGIVDADQEKSMDDIADAYLAGGATVLQLRMKSRPVHDVVEFARALLGRCHAAGATLIINDRADIAACVGADGVHLGQTDIPISAARQMLPKGLIGRSTHDLRQLHLAVQEGADYVGFGPIFPTRSKRNTAPAVGVQQLLQAVKVARVPLVAVGGISIDNIRQVVGAGAKCAATISAVSQAWQPKDAVRSLARAFRV